MKLLHVFRANVNCNSCDCQTNADVEKSDREEFDSNRDKLTKVNCGQTQKVEVETIEEVELKAGKRRAPIVTYTKKTQRRTNDVTCIDESLYIFPVSDAFDIRRC